MSHNPTPNSPCKSRPNRQLRKSYIYLDGAILGMNRAEITRKFDEIVAFAGVDKFLDTPVKRYSSGMYVRLAFAVAAHLEPEILIVDEVFAVGDAQFQKKCLGKMGEVAKGGRTVLFVSHNMSAVQSLCKSLIWLESGHVRQSGNLGFIMTEYMSGGEKPAAGSIRRQLQLGKSMVLDSIQMIPATPVTWGPLRIDLVVRLAVAVG